MFEPTKTYEKVCTGISDGMEAGVKSVVGGEQLFSCYLLISWLRSLVICPGVCSYICYPPLKSYLLEARTTLKVLFLSLGHNMGARSTYFFICTFCWVLIERLKSTFVRFQLSLKGDDTARISLWRTILQCCKVFFFIFDDIRSQQSYESSDVTIPHLFNTTMHYAFVEK